MSILPTFHVDIYEHEEFDYLGNLVICLIIVFVLLYTL